MAVQNVLPVLTNPSPGDSMASPSHALSEHSQENDYIMWLSRTWRARSGTDPGIVNLRGVSVSGLYASGDYNTDDSPYVQAACDLLPATGGLIIAPPGGYRLNSNITVTNKGAIWFVALSGRRFVAPVRGALAQPQGTSFISGTNGMTMFTFTRTSGPEMSNGGPSFLGFSFEDRTVIQASVAPTAATNTGSTITFTVPSGHGIVGGDVIMVKNVYPAGGTSEYVGRFTVASVTATTIVVPAAATIPGTVGAGTTFSNALIAYDTFPTAKTPTVTGVDLNNISRTRFDQCNFYGLLIGFRSDASSAFDADDSKCIDTDFALCNTGALLSGSGPQGWTFRSPYFNLSRGQIGIDVQDKAENLTVEDPFIHIGQDGSSGDAAIGIKLRKGGEWSISNPKADMDVRVGAAFAIEVGAAGKSIGTISSPRLRATHVEGRKAFGVWLNGTDAANPVHGVSILGGDYNGLLRGIHFGPFTKACSAIAPGFTDCDEGVRYAAGSLGNSVLFPSQGSGAVSGSILVNDLSPGGGNITLFERDIANGRVGGVELATQATPLAPVAGKILLFADTNGVASARKTDGTVVSLEGGGSGTTVGAIITKAKLASRSAQLAAAATYSLLKWSVPASFVSTGFMVEGELWALITTLTTAAPTCTIGLNVGGVSRTTLTLSPATAQSSTGYKQKFSLALHGISGQTNQNGTFDVGHEVVTTSPSGAANQLRQEFRAVPFTQNIINTFDIEMVLTIAAGGFVDALTGVEAISGRISLIA